MFFGFIALGFYVYSIQFSDKKKLLILLGIANVFYSLQYLMLNAYTALYVCIIAIVRSLIFLKYEQQNKKMDLLPLIALLIPISLGAFLGYSNILSLLPIVSTSLYTISLWKGNLKRFRIVCIITSTMWLAYNIVIFAFAGIISNVIELIGGFKAINKAKKEQLK